MSLLVDGFVCELLSLKAGIFVSLLYERISEKLKNSSTHQLKNSSTQKLKN
jgi:hypothetical protein